MTIPMSVQVEAASPISTLPFETLAGIFEAAHGLQSEKHFIEVVLSSVCRHWRDVALGSPKLWTVIRCNASGKQPGATPIYLRRSSGLPIDLTIGFNGHKLSRMKALFQLLGRHFWRCQHLRVTCVGQTVLNRLLQDLQSINAPFLRSIEINCQNYIIPKGPRTGDIFAGGAPMLAEIRFNNIELERCLPPLASVKAIYLQQSIYVDLAPESTFWLRMIAAATSIRHLQIDSDTIVQDWTSSTITVEMPLLLSLYLFCGSDDPWGVDVAVPLDRIIAPSLEVLMLRGIETFGAFMSLDKFPSLHTIVLWEAIGEVTDLLESFPHHVQHMICGGLADFDYQLLLDALGYGDAGDDEVGESDTIELPESFQEGAQTDEGVHETLGEDGRHGHLERNGSTGEEIATGDEYISPPPYLPHLQTIAILPSLRHAFPLDATRDMLLGRKFKGRPLRKLYVATRFLAEVSEEFPTWEGLVEVEVWRPQLTPCWPNIWE